MCCGGGSEGCGYLVANVFYVTERLASCCAAVAVVVCLVGTLLSMLALGVGLGYNYCSVAGKLQAADLQAEDESTTKSSGRKRRSLEEESTPPPSPVPRAPPATMVVPRGSDLLSLLTKLSRQNKNVTLHIVQ